MRNGRLFDAIALVIFTEFLASLNGYLLMGGFRFVVTASSLPRSTNFTKWGYQEVQRDPKNKAFGGHIHKLLFDTLGTKYFPENSVYSWFPMTLPQAMEASFADN